MTTVREVKTSYGYTIVITPQRRPTALDLKIDSQVSLRPILKWNGVEYDVLLDNIPDELERHFDPVRIGFIQNELRIPLERLGLRVERTRVSRIRDLLHTDNNLHDRGVCQSKGGMPIRANRIV